MQGGRLSNMKAQAVQVYGIVIGPLRTAANHPATKPELPIDHTHEMPAIARLERAGFTAEFKADGDAVRVTGTTQRYVPDELLIRDYYRFEGTSDPDDMSVIYAVEARDGTRGTLIDAYGSYADPAIGNLISQIEVEPLPAGG
jgi:hypothetical protein